MVVITQGGYEFQSCTCHNKNTTGEEGNGKPPQKAIDFRLKREESPALGNSKCRHHKMRSRQEVGPGHCSMGIAVSGPKSTQGVG